MAELNRSTHVQPVSQNFKPDERNWTALCDAAGTRYRGYIKPVLFGLALNVEAIVLFNDWQGFATGLSVSEFTAENIRERMKRKPRASA